jgi:hypothetical protein
MNERIRELQIQAEAAADEIFDRQGKMYGEIVMEKFAELIVAECAKIVEDSTWNLPHGYKTVDQANLVKQHFGVKE